MKQILNKEQAGELLARFYEGHTTPTEERQLAEFFRSGNIPAEWEADYKLFLAMTETTDVQLPTDIAEEITAFVNNLGQENEQQPMPMSEPRKGIIYRLKTPPKMFYRAAVVVAVLMALGGSIGWYQSMNNPFRDTCANAEEAAQEILYANDIINRSTAPFLQSANIAMEQVNEMNKTIQKATQYQLLK
ncbi:MAG: hypothetical protein IJ776_06900 [Paludibacteraceae bacterium]|nr:hypothetical protein [Paludibacteraceae bacterium]